MSAALSNLAALLDQLQARVTELEGKAGIAAPAAPATASKTTAAAVDDEAAQQTKDWDLLVAKYGDEIAKLGAEIGGDVAVLGQTYLALFKAVRQHIHLATKCKKPDAETLTKLRSEVVSTGAPIFDLKKKRDCTHPNHAAGVADAAPAFAWVTMDVGALDFINSAKESCDFFLNKVRKESKDKNLPAWMTFANLVRDSVGAIYDYVKENYKTGFAFNPKGGDVAAFLGATSSAPKAAPTAATPAPVATPAPAATSAPAPAKTPTPATSAGGAAAVADGAALQSQLFAQLGAIDQSSGKTAGLRHVTKDMKASAQKGAEPAVVKAAPTPVARASKDEALPTGTARLELVDRRWYVEFQQTSGTQLHVPPEANITQEVYLYACKDVAVFVDSKVKGVRMDKCRNVTLILESVLSGVEVVNCKKIKMQVKQSLPSIAIDKTDGILVGLAWPARAAQIVTSKSSEMNVTFPVSADAEADWIELPIPEQFVTKLTEKNVLHTGVSELYTS